LSFRERHYTTAKILKLDEGELAPERFADEFTPAPAGAAGESRELAFELAIEADGEG
jgi:hypothetical protein